MATTKVRSSASGVVLRLSITVRGPSHLEYSNDNRRITPGEIGVQSWPRSVGPDSLRSRMEYWEGEPWRVVSDKPNSHCAPSATEYERATVRPMDRVCSMPGTKTAVPTSDSPSQSLPATNPDKVPSRISAYGSKREMKLFLGHGLKGSQHKGHPFGTHAAHGRNYTNFLACKGLPSRWDHWPHLNSRVDIGLRKEPFDAVNG